MRAVTRSESFRPSLRLRLGLLVLLPLDRRKRLAFRSCLYELATELALQGRDRRAVERRLLIEAFNRIKLEAFFRIRSMLRIESWQDDLLIVEHSPSFRVISQPLRVYGYVGRGARSLADSLNSITTALEKRRLNADDILSSDFITRSPDRPELQVLLELVRARAVDVVIVASIRDLDLPIRELGRLFAELQRSQVALWSVHEGIDTHQTSIADFSALVASLASLPRRTRSDTAFVRKIRQVGGTDVPERQD
jgi:hypothetical protein